MNTADILALVFGCVGALTGSVGIVFGVVADRRAKEANLIALKAIEIEKKKAEAPWSVKEGYEMESFTFTNESTEKLKIVEICVPRIQSDGEDHSVVWDWRSSRKEKIVSPGESFGVSAEKEFFIFEGDQLIPEEAILKYETEEGIELATRLALPADAYLIVDPIWAKEF